MLKKLLKIWLFIFLSLSGIAFALYVYLEAPKPVRQVAKPTNEALGKGQSAEVLMGIPELPSGEKQVAAQDLDILRGLKYTGTLDGILTDKPSVYLRTKHNRFEVIDHEFWEKNYPNSEISMNEFQSEGAFVSLLNRNPTDPKIVITQHLCALQIPVVIYERVAMNNLADEDAHASGEPIITNACQYIATEVPHLPSRGIDPIGGGSGSPLSAHAPY